jgi:hypothetical protein
MNWGIGFRSSQYGEGSLWILPLLGAIIGVLFAEIGLRLDAAGVLGAHLHAPETATAVLSAAIAAAASLTGFVITVTVLGVRLATGTFSSRRSPAPPGTTTACSSFLTPSATSCRWAVAAFTVTAPVPAPPGADGG